MAEVIKQIAQEQKTVILIDQIDALSAVLSADRRPLASITTFINEVTRIQQEGRQKRAEAEKTLVAMEKNLKEKLLTM